MKRTEGIAAAGGFSVAARLNRLPVTPFHRRLVLICAIGLFFDIFDLYMSGYIGARLLKTGFFTHGELYLFFSAAFAGMFFGAIAMGYTGDVLGRRAMFVLGLIGYSVLMILAAFSPSAGWLIAARFVAGLGLGAEYIISDTYLGEMLPRRSRARYISLTYAGATIGSPVVAFLATWLVPHQFGAIDGWRVLMVLGGIGAFAGWWMRIAMVESPRWLEAKGRHAEAARILDAIEAEVAKESGRALPAPQEEVAVVVSERVPLGELFAGAYRGRLALMVAFQFLQTFGYFGFLIWAPTILVKEGFALVHALLYVALTMILGPIGALVGAVFVERWERKWAISVLALGIAVFGLAFAFSRSPMLIVINGGLVTLLSNWFSAVFHPYQMEIFPTRLRATAGGFAYAWSRFSVAVSAPLIGFILEGTGVVGVFAVIAAAMVLITIIIGAFGPRTNSLALEVIAE